MTIVNMRMTTTNCSNYF